MTGSASGCPARCTTCRCNHQPVLAEYAGPSLPVAEDIAARHICLPVHSDMTDAEVDEVLTAMTAVHETLPGG